MDNYRVIEQKLRNLEPFNGNTLRAFWDERGYNVVSYYTRIASAVGTEREIDSRRYSVTTSKHQGLIRRAWGFPPLPKASQRAWA